MEEAYKNGYLLLAYTSEASLDYLQYFEKDYFYPIVAMIRSDSHKMIFMRNIWKKRDYDLFYYKNQDKLPSTIQRQIEKYDEISVSMMSNQIFI